MERRRWRPSAVGRCAEMPPCGRARMPCTADIHRTMTRDPCGRPQGTWDAMTARQQKTDRNAFPTDGGCPASPAPSRCLRRRSRARLLRGPPSPPAQLVPHRCAPAANHLQLSTQAKHTTSRKAAADRPQDRVPLDALAAIAKNARPALRKSAVQLLLDRAMRWALSCTHPPPTPSASCRLTRRAARAICR